MTILVTAQRPVRSHIFRGFSVHANMEALTGSLGGSRVHTLLGLWGWVKANVKLYRQL